MLHPEILQFLTIMLTFFARKGYHELFRPRITNMQWLNRGDLLIAVIAFGFGVWSYAEWATAMTIQTPVPSIWLRQSLHNWLLLSLIFPGWMLLLGLVWRGRLPSFLIGLGRGFLTFGVAIGIIPLIWWSFYLPKS
jgi:hypothetical protein